MRLWPWRTVLCDFLPIPRLPRLPRSPGPLDVAGRVLAQLASTCSPAWACSSGAELHQQQALTLQLMDRVLSNGTQALGRRWSTWLPPFEPLATHLQESDGLLLLLWELALDHGCPAEMSMNAFQALATQAAMACSRRLAWLTPVLSDAKQKDHWAARVRLAAALHGLHRVQRNGTSATAPAAVRLSHGAVAWFHFSQSCPPLAPTMRSVFCSTRLWWSKARKPVPP